MIIGKNEILFNDNEESVTTSETLAVAIVNEIEANNYSQERFTVINK